MYSTYIVFMKTGFNFDLFVNTCVERIFWSLHMYEDKEKLKKTGKIVDSSVSNTRHFYI